METSQGTRRSEGRLLPRNGFKQYLWHLTFVAHMEAVLSRLCRLYDKHPGALSLGRFLLTVKDNRAFFSDAAFRQRLKQNRHVASLAKNRAIDDAELSRELSSVSRFDPLVLRLWDIRDKAISHTDAELIRKDEAGASRLYLPAEDIETLLNRASDITSKYSLLYRASLHGGIFGADDYKSTLKWLRQALSSHRAEVEKEIEQIIITTQLSQSAGGRHSSS
ncbi:MAG TPA: hypothetical protein VG206_18200 [Terriglobia bacterium]|nr:hypothetical protein [Terriglobia bacterium]